MEWLSEFDRDMQKQGMHVLLVIGNCSALHVQTSPTAVTLLFLPPTTTSKVQPGRGKSDAKESDVDDDETSEPAPRVRRL